MVHGFLMHHVHLVLNQHLHHLSVSIDVHLQGFLLVPIQSQKVFKKIIAPFCWCGGPCSFKSTGNSITSITGAKSIFPARLCSSIPAAAGSLPTYLPGSAAPCVLPNVCPPAINAQFLHHSLPCGQKFPGYHGQQQWIRISVRSFRVYINQSHLNSSQVDSPIHGRRYSVYHPTILFQHPNKYLLLVPKHLHVHQQNQKF